jgi:outer membrane protein assembly factor BamB/predicted phosphodiesterase
MKSKPDTRVLRRWLELVFGVLPLSVLLAAAAFAQTTRFAVVTDTHVGANHAASDLRTIVETLKADPEIRFIVLDGDITEKGRDGEFEEAKAILAGLTAPFHVLPGNHDLHWLGFGWAGFRQAFGTDRFFFRRENTAFIGLSGGDRNHLTPYDLDWLAETIRPLPPETDIYFFIHFPPASIDNWISAHNLLRTHRTMVISGHVHADQQTEMNGIPVFTVRPAVSGSRPSGFAVFEIGPEAVVAEATTPDHQVLPIGRVLKSEWKPASAIAIVPPRPLPGRELWRRELRTYLHAGPVSDGKSVFIADQSGRITCLDAKGGIRWTFDGPSPFISRPIVHKKQLFAASADGRMIKLDANSGRQLASAEFRERFTSPLAAFEDVQVKVPRLLAGTASGRLLCVNLFNLTDVWISGAARGAIQSSPLAADGRAVFGAWDGSAHALDIETGRELWRWTENDNVYYSPAGCAPAAANGRVFFCCPDGFVSAVDGKTGRTLWRVAAGSWESLGLSADRKKILIKGRLDAVSILDAASGTVLQKIGPAHDAGDIFPAEPIEDGGRILFGAQNGRVYEIDGRGAIRPILDLGPGAIHTLLALGGGRYIAANIDGLVAAFEIPK